MSDREPPESAILRAAKEVFLQKGLSGARMQDIADRAGINKALLHYYFRSKEKLFEITFRSYAGLLFKSGMRILGGDAGLIETIEAFVANYIDILIQDPDVPIFVFHEIQQNPELPRILFTDEIRPDPGRFAAKVRAAVLSGLIRPIDPVQLIMNIISLCMFPFVGKRSFQAILGIPDDQFRHMLEDRKKEVSRLIVDSIRPI